MTTKGEKNANYIRDDSPQHREGGANFARLEIRGHFPRIEIYLDDVKMEDVSELTLHMSPDSLPEISLIFVKTDIDIDISGAAFKGEYLPSDQPDIPVIKLTGET